MRQRWEKVVRYFHTLRSLKLRQFWGRLWFRLYHPRPDLRPPPSLRAPTGFWCDPARKEPSLLDSYCFRFLNQKHELSGPAAWNNPAWDKLWLYNLHYFDDLNATGRENRVGQHRDLVQRWIKENPPATGNGWEPYPISLRIVNWVKWGLAGSRLSEKATHSLAVQTRYLRKRLEYHLLGNHLFANGKALVFAGLFFEGREAEEWLRKGRQILDHEIAEQILKDGGHFERSPMYHSIILEDLLDLKNILRGYGQDLPPAWLAAIRRMRGWLQVMCHQDGEIVLFNDAAFGIACTPAEIDAYAIRLGLAQAAASCAHIVHLAESGYLRLDKGGATVFLDVAPIGPDYLPGHGHADTLSFELSLFGHRVIVDSGTSCYGSNAERLRQRSTAAHNTVAIDGENSSEVWGGFRVARRANPVGLIVEEQGDTVRVRCGHNGFTRLPGKPIHYREWLLKNKEVSITDRIEGPFAKATGRFHFHPDLFVSKDVSGRNGQVTLPGGKKLSWKVMGGLCRIIDTTWHPEFGLSIPNTCLEIEFQGAECRTVFAW